MGGNITGKPIGFEQEVNIGDEENRPVNYIDVGSNKELIASHEVLRVLNEHPKYKKLIADKKGKHIAKAELDASQIEIYNPIPDNDVNRLQEELYETYNLVEEIARSFGYRLIDDVVPNQDFTPVHSGATDRYQFIHDKLSSVGNNARKATNIIGTHLTFDAGEDMINHIAISQYVRNCLLRNEYNALFADVARIEKYKTVVAALQTLDFVETGYLPQDLYTADDVKRLQMDKEGNDLFGYELVRKKSFCEGKNKQHLSELRVVDGPTSAEEVITQTTNALLILEESLATYTHKIGMQASLMENLSQ